MNQNKIPARILLRLLEDKAPQLKVIQLEQTKETQILSPWLINLKLVFRKASNSKY